MSVALDIAALLAEGGTLFGIPIVALMVKTIDGREQSLQLPIIDQDEPRELSQLASEILQVLTEEGDWLMGGVIASRISDDVDHTSGNWSRAVKELRDAGLIESQTRRGYRAVIFRDNDSPMMLDLIQWIREQPVDFEFTADIAANGAGYSSPTSGPFRDALRELVTRGVIQRLPGNRGFKKSCCI